MIAIIDKGEGFAYNLYQMIERAVVLESAAADEIKKASHLIISSYLTREELAPLFDRPIPILGVGSGCQAVCAALGASCRAGAVFHGRKISVHVANGNPLFRGLPPLIEAGGYYSQIVDRRSLPDELLVIAEDGQGEVMGVKHKQYNLYGLQFSIESILTPNGQRIMDNFLALGGGRA